MCVKIIAVGSNPLIANEVEYIVKRILGEDIETTPMLTHNVTGKENTDLYVCALTQRLPLLKKISQEQLCVLDLRPTAQFFIDISHIPAGEIVYIFNSNQQYAEMLRHMCHEHKIDHLQFVTIAYEDMPEETVIRHLQQAKYIIGVGKLVEKEVLLSEKYRKFLRQDVKIIGRTRMATMETACMLLEKVQEMKPKTSSGDAANEQKSIHQHLLDSLTAQLSDQLTAQTPDDDTNTEDIAVTLHKIGNMLNTANQSQHGNRLS